jgi:hypothetical protein
LTEEHEGYDLVAFFLLDVFFISYFLLATYGTPMFLTTVIFGFMLLSGVVGLALLRGYAPTLDEEGEVADFDEPLTAYSLLVGFLVGLGLLALSGLLSGLFQGFSILWVPKPDIAMFALGPLNPQVIGNIIYQFALVGPAEETLKLAGIYAVYSRIPEDLPLRETISVTIPTGFWAVFHAILAGFTPWLILTAFIAGIAIYVFALKITSNIITAFIAHASYNSSIIILATLVPGGV